MIRVLVVDDSAFMRNMITKFLTSNHEIAVAGTARNGEEALQKIKELRPDVITLDIEMPVMNGKETLKRIMASDPLPVVMVSSLTQRGSRYHDRMSGAWGDRFRREAVGFDFNRFI